MKLLSKTNLLYFLALIAVAYALLTIFNAEEKISDTRIEIAVLASLSYLIGMAFWNFAWGEYLNLRSIQSIRLGFASQIGGLTPLSVGADFLRGYFGKSAGKKVGDGIAASLAAKFHKLLLVLLLSIVGIGVLVFEHTELRENLMAGLLVPIAMLLGVYFLTKNYASDLISKYSLKRIKKSEAKGFSRKLKAFIYRPQIEILVLLLLSLAFEFFAFYLSLLALNIVLPVASTYLLFILLFFASKALLVPQGLGITEVLGLFILGGTISIATVAASLLVWNAVRIWVPIVVSGMVLFSIEKKIEF